MFRLRFALKRLPILWWAAAVALAGVTGAAVSKSVATAQDLAGAYGPLEPMVVAARHLDFGAVLEPADLDLALVPARLAPAGRVADADLLVGRTALAPLVAGQPVVGAHVSPDGVSGVAALLPPGTRAVAVPTGGVSAPVRLGDRVDVLASFDPQLAAGSDPTFPVAVAALVVDVGPDAATVAVAPAEAVAVAFAASNGALTVVLASPAETGGYPGP